MGRTSGALARTHVRIVDHHTFAGVVSALASRGLFGETGLRAISRESGIPASRLSDWMQARRHGLSREHFQRLHDAVIYSTDGDLSMPHGLDALFRSVEAPANGRGFYPEDPPRTRRRRRTREAVFIEDIVGAAADRIARGQTPSAGSPFWDDALWQRELFERPVYVTVALLRVLESRLALSIGYEADDGAPITAETDRGARCVIWIRRPLEIVPTS